MTGSAIGHYRVRGKLGTGGMGIVYGAEDTRLDPRKFTGLGIIKSVLMPAPEKRQKLNFTQARTTFHGSPGFDEICSS